MRRISSAHPPYLTDVLSYAKYLGYSGSHISIYLLSFLTTKESGRLLACSWWRPGGEYDAVEKAFWGWIVVLGISGRVWIKGGCLRKLEMTRRQGKVGL